MKFKEFKNTKNERVNKHFSNKSSGLHNLKQLYKFLTNFKVKFFLFVKNTNYFCYDRIFTLIILVISPDIRKSSFQACM